MVDNTEIDMYAWHGMAFSFYFSYEYSKCSGENNACNSFVFAGTVYILTILLFQGTRSKNYS
jgi:hypothetical protein